MKNYFERFHGKYCRKIGEGLRNKNCGGGGGGLSEEIRKD
jgi:hypothetical protein